MKFLTISAVVLILMFSLFPLSALADNEERNFYNFIQSQFKNLPNSSQRTNSSSSDSNFVIEIGTLHDVEPGSMIDVPVTLRNAPFRTGGFNLLIYFPVEALSLFSISESEKLFSDSGCRWEYFQYRIYSDILLLPESTYVRRILITAFADINADPSSPKCFIPETPIELFKFTFLVTNDQTWQCQKIPIGFVWYKCNDNIIAYDSSNFAYGSSIMAAVSNNLYDDDELLQTEDSFPTFNGAIDTCVNDPLHPFFLRNLDLYNGGIFIQCDSTPVLIGDIDLDEFPYGVHDAGLFVQYFYTGTPVFKLDPNRQIAATDINRDGETLKLEDLTQLSRIVLGELHPDSTIDSTLVGSIVLNDKATKSVRLQTDYAADLIWIKMTGDIEPLNPTDSSLLGHTYDGNHTRILFGKSPGYGPGNVDLFTYTGEGDIVEAQAATRGGIEITLRIDDVTTSIEESDDILPSAFALHQNYPNPFNIETTIKFDLPNASEVCFEIFNILGQIVYNVTNRYSAGSHTIYWDGSSNSGQTVGSGIYYYRITAADFVSSKKMILLK